MITLTAEIKNLFEKIRGIERIESFHLTWHQEWPVPRLSIKKENTFTKTVQGPINWEEGVYESIIYTVDPAEFEGCIFFTSIRMTVLGGTIAKNTFFTIKGIEGAMVKIVPIHGYEFYWKSTFNFQQLLEVGSVKKIKLEDLIK